MKKWCFAAMTLLVLFSCAPKQEEVKKERFFWPPPPDEPKVEFIDILHSSRELEKPNPLAWLLGETRPEIKLRKPLGISSDGEGIVVVTDFIPSGGTVWDLNRQTVEFISKDASFKLSSGVAFDAQRLYVADAKAGNIKVFAKKDRKPLYTVGDGELESPNGMAVNESLKRLYVVDTKSHKVAVYDTETKKQLFSFGKGGDKEGEFNRPWDVALDKSGDVYVADGLNARVQIFDKDGKFISMFGKRGTKAGGFSQVKGIGLDSDGNIYIADPLKAIQVFSRDGKLLGLVGAPGNKGVGAMSLPMGLYIDKNDRIYVADQMNKRFHIYQYMNEEYKKKNPADFGGGKK